MKRFKIITGTHQECEDKLNEVFDSFFYNILSQSSTVTHTTLTLALTYQRKTKLSELKKSE